MTEDGLPDEVLLAELRRIFALAEPAPPHVVAAAKATFELRTLDADLALLVWDSDVDEPAIAVRGPGGPGAAGAVGPRALSFEADDLAVEVEIAAPAAGRGLLGQLVPGQPGRVEVHRVAAPGAPAQVKSVDADALGRFAVPALDPGLLRLACACPGRRVVSTSWFRVD